MSGPITEDEKGGDASRVEVYRCSDCPAVTRFPRYNNVATLIHSRTGRCGEWANAFTGIARACDFDVRYVLDFTDHVWTELWSDEEGRWMHADSCEGALDTPLVYSTGWGKKLNYVFAFSREEIADVARRYAPNWHDTISRRTLVTEKWL